MNRTTKNILKHTPYNTYDDLFNALYNQKTSIKLSNGACRQIASLQKPLFANWGIMLGALLSAFLTVFSAIYSGEYLLLLLLILYVFLPHTLYLLKGLNIKTWFVPTILVLVDLFLVKLPLGVLLFLCSWIICSWTIDFWRKRLYIRSIKILQYDEDAFAWAWHSNNLMIEDCYGNLYSKIRTIQEYDKEGHDRLLRILEFGANIQGLDTAINKFSAFYIKKGKTIPFDLFENLDDLSEQEKHENLLEILECGLDDKGLTNITNRLLAFYEAKGIVFPDNIL